MVSSSLPDLHTLSLESAQDPLYAAAHLDILIGALRCRVLRGCIRASIKDPLSESRDIPFDYDVLKWVRVYVGGERLNLDTT
jgi:hypothetical protein